MFMISNPLGRSPRRPRVNAIMFDKLKFRFPFKPNYFSEFHRKKTTISSAFNGIESKSWVPNYLSLSVKKLERLEVDNNDNDDDDLNES